MDNNNQQAQRLLKANDVQRRRFEKMVDEAMDCAERAQRDVINDHREIAKQAVVREIMGDDYDALMEIRARIIGLKQQIQGYQDKGEEIAKRLRKDGLEVNKDYRGRYTTDFGYYVDPHIPNEDEENDVCRTTVGDPTVTLDIRYCRSSPAYAEYERRILDTQADEEELKQDERDLRQKVWALVTTEEITAEIDKFYDKWCD